MMNINQCVVAMVTCASLEEASKIVVRLLELRLIACGKCIPANAMFHWQGTVDSAQEVMVIMETILDHFESIEKEIKSLHSYQTFVLIAMPVVRISEQARKWLQDSVQPEKA